MPHRAISETNAADRQPDPPAGRAVGHRPGAPRSRDRPVAGKTGTTENYGDAWFVGYTPQLAVAVWVGLPEHAPADADRSTTASPVAGGTFPALIFKSFMEQALPYLDDAPESFAYPRHAGRRATRSSSSATARSSSTTGSAGTRSPVAYFAGRGPAKTANCRPNEVEVPNVVGTTYDVARARLAAQPLTPLVVYKPASPEQPLGVVVKQIPRGGRLSSFDKVTIVFAKPLHGVVPNVVGLRLPQARDEARSG